MTPPQWMTLESMKLTSFQEVLRKWLHQALASLSHHVVGIYTACYVSSMWHMYVISYLFVYHWFFYSSSIYHCWWKHHSGDCWGWLCWYLLYVRRQPHPHHHLGVGRLRCTILTGWHNHWLCGINPKHWIISIHRRKPNFNTPHHECYQPRPQWGIHMCWLQLTWRSDQHW